MTDHLADLWQRLLAGEDVSNDDVLWSILLVGMLFASVHLVTMLITRWGDQKATTKSLVFSIVLHLSCGVGLLAMNVPRSPETSDPQKPKPPEPAQFVEVRLDGAETFQTDLSGNTPLFDRLPRPEETVLTRREQHPLDLRPPPQPKRERTSPTRSDIDEPTLPTLPRAQPAVPRPIDEGRKGSLRQASVPHRIFDETAQKRPEASNPSPLDQRVQIPRPAQTDEPVVREMKRGSAERVEDRIDLHKRLATLDGERRPEAALRRGEERPLVQTRVSPTRPIVNSDDTGGPARRTAKGTGGANPQPKRIRLATRPPDGVPGGGIDRFRPEIAPRSPNSRDADRRLAVRRGPHVDSLRSGPRPNVLRPGAPVQRARRTSKVPSTYRLRSLANRKASAEKFGGTDASEKAVERALNWLAEHQHPDGYWDSDRYGAGKVDRDERGVERKHAGKNADTGITALALLAFLGAGYTHEEGPYARTVDKALRWLVSQQTDAGFLGGNASHYARMYCHGMATYAIAEAYGMQSDPTVDTRLRGPLRKAVTYILDAQNRTDGGWRYVNRGWRLVDGRWRFVNGQRGDMSMFGWQLMALKSAEIAGLSIPDDAKKGMIAFLKEHSFGRNKGLAAYQKSYPVTATMTAEALFCKQMFRIPREHPASKEAVAYLMDRLPRRAGLNLYYWYYGTLAMFQYGGPDWKKWNEAVQGALVAEQVTTGKYAGSWDPKGRWGPYGGRVFSTALSALCLEVYYRFLPLYKMSGRG